ncbi:MAG: 2-oxoglutarate dehydrogenase complex dihydrolipoyllysine-residue succinyltransferase [Desulfobacteraceae bacterium]|nr:MAG: 2-oxoglutarate dehydrogenase complex dihydrolipoyllysine-residue succinyltransferase [Desulfobacteraceae bacterium]
MALEIKIPNVGESVQEAVLAQWYKKEGDYVLKDEPLFVIETDKVTLEVPAEASGRLHILAAEGDTLSIGAVVGSIDTDAVAEKSETRPETGKPELKPVQKPRQTETAVFQETERKETPVPPSDRPASETPLLPSVRRLVLEKGLDIKEIQGTGPGGRITKGDVILYLESGNHAAVQQHRDQTEKEAAPCVMPGQETVTIKPMTPIRKRIAERLLSAKQNTAMLTTFNEIDMSHVMAIRNRYKDAFFEKYRVRLGFMSFFIKAVVEELKETPDMNARIDGDNIVYQHYYHIGVAIGAKRGLLVPVIRNADQISFAQVEGAIVEFAKKINENRIQLEDLEGGTFSITNGGIYGSLLSTPILNMPQSGILGMHKIEDRPIVIENEIKIRPMMYVALSYDHRIVDGKTAVTFLRRIKELIENPERIMMEI